MADRYGPHGAQVGVVCGGGYCVDAAGLGMSHHSGAGCWEHAARREGGHRWVDPQPTHGVGVPRERAVTQLDLDELSNYEKGRAGNVTVLALEALAARGAAYADADAVNLVLSFYQGMPVGL